jgi:ER lumen protein retaining receptor
VGDIPADAYEQYSKEMASHDQVVQKIIPYSWNIFRYVGDYLHLFGVFVLLATLAKNKGTTGFSRSTQIMYFLVFITRYLDLLDHNQTAYLVFFKITYIFTSVIVLFFFSSEAGDKTYERQKDTCSLAAILAPSCVAAIILTDDHSALEVLWTFSQFAEGFAMVPQYIFCYRDRFSQDWMVGLYVICLGGYRVFYAANWIYKKVNLPQYNDIQSWIGGVIEICFFTDYLLSRFTGFSLLRAMVLKVDEKINEIQGAVEMKVLGKSTRLKAAQELEESGASEMRQRRKKQAEEDAMEV